MYVLSYINCFAVELVLCNLYVTVKSFDSSLSRDLLFDTFSITVWYKLCRCDKVINQFFVFD